MLDSVVYAFVYASAKLWHGTVLTGDPHFKQLKKGIYNGEEVREPEEMRGDEGNA